MFKLSDNNSTNIVLNEIVSNINNFAEKQLKHIDRLTNIGYSLSKEKDIDKIFHLILEEAIEFTNADGATIYSISKDKKFLDFALLNTRSKNYIAGGHHGKVNIPAVPLYDEDKLPNMKNLASCVFHTKEGFNFDDYYTQNKFDPSGTMMFDKNNNYRSKSMIAMPLLNHDDDVLGVIQLINAQDSSNNIISFTQEHSTMLRSLASQAAVSLTNKQLIISLETLLHDFIKAIATAIDRKDKTTGGHIERVSKITNLIAKKVNEAKSGYFQDVHLTSNEIDELNIAAWLHDVGKIATPDYVMNKASKLDGQFDKVELIRTKLETITVLYHNSDYVSDAFKKKLCFDYIPYAVSTIEEYRLAILKQTKLDMDTIRKVNIGAEFTNKACLIEIERISSFVYYVLDKKHYWISNDNKRNLQITKGTLNDDERKVMNDHVRFSYEILSQITYPKKYAGVPLIASTHHEKLNGTGHPWGFNEDQLPLQSRILAIADIFEALTAPDRPYKQGKLISEAMTILATMVRYKHVDKDLFELLLDSKLYLEYSKENVPHHQIDELNREEIMEIIGKIDTN